MERKYISCKVCDHFHWTDKKCPPIFTIEYEDGDRKVHGNDFEEAAEKFAENYNERHDYCLMNQQIEIKVTNSKGIEKKFIIGAEQSIEYWSKEI